MTDKRLCITLVLSVSQQAICNVLLHPKVDVMIMCIGGHAECFADGPESQGVTSTDRKGSSGCHQRYVASGHWKGLLLHCLLGLYNQAEPSTFVALLPPIALNSIAREAKPITSKSNQINVFWLRTQNCRCYRRCSAILVFLSPTVQ